MRFLPNKDLPIGSRRGAAYRMDRAYIRATVLVALRDSAANGDLVTGLQGAVGRCGARPGGVAAGPDLAVYFASGEGANALFRPRRAWPQEAAR